MHIVHTGGLNKQKRVVCVGFVLQYVLKTMDCVLCEIWGSHTGASEDPVLLGYNIVLIGK